MKAYIQNIGGTWYAYAGDTTLNVVWGIGHDCKGGKRVTASWTDEGIQSIASASPTRQAAYKRVTAWIMAGERLGEAPRQYGGEKGLPPAKTYSPVAQRLRAARERLGYTQRQAANLIGALEPNYRQWELDMNPVPRARIKKVSEVLGIDPADLI